MNTVVTAAVTYLSLGISVLPLDGKRPAIASWKPLQHAAPSIDDVEGWQRRFASMNLGIVTGKVSGLVVIDADSQAAIDAVERDGAPITPTVQTARGRHYYFAHPGDLVRNGAGVLPGVDVRGDGGYVVAPPSIHHGTGMVYEWLPGLALGDVELAPLPDWFLHLTAPAPSSTSTHEPLRVQPTQIATERLWALLEGSRTGRALPGQLVIASGNRNTTLTSIAGKLRRADYPDHDIANDLHRINELACTPPLDAAEVDAVAASILRHRPGGVRSRLRWLRECVSRAAIPGRSALTLRRVYEAHIDIAIHARRGTYTASVRQIAEHANVASRTVVARHRDLVTLGLLERLDLGSGARATRWRIPRDAVIQLRTLITH